MKIKSIHIENFRSAKDFNIEFNEDLNVLVGVNGAGKTTILEALTLCMSWFIKRVQRKGAAGLSIAESDIRYGASSANIKIICTENETDYSWELVRYADGKAPETKSDYTGASDLAFHFQEVLEQEDRLPIIAYYPVSRVVDKINPDLRSNESSTLDAYDKALDGKQNFQSFFEWFRQQDDILNEKATSRKKWVLANKKSLQKRVKNIIESALMNVLKTKAYHRIDIFEQEFIYHEPFILFHEISRMIEDNVPGFRVINRRFYQDLEHLFHVIERQERDEIFDSEKRDNQYKELLHDVLADFDTAIKESHLPTKMGMYLDSSVNTVLRELIILANELSLWWLSSFSRNKIENQLRSSLKEIGNGKDNSKEILKDLETFVFRIIAEELNTKKNAEGNQGRELIFVKKAIEQFIPNYTNLRVRRVPIPHMLIDKEGVEFNLNQLSDGEKNLITLVGDIARRLSIANPKSNDPLKENGIIMIDEIDLHLHPKWQQLMIPQLQKIFPNCQFIVSTHSPQVLNQVQPENIVLLQNIDNKLTYSFATESYGKNSDRILEDLLGVDSRPSDIKDEIEKLYQHIESGKLDKAKELYKDLSNKIIGGDPELVKANVLIKRKEITGK